MSHGACAAKTRNHGVCVPAIDVLPNDDACIQAAVWSKTTLCTWASENGSGPHVTRTTSAADRRGRPAPPAPARPLRQAPTSSRSRRLIEDYTTDGWRVSPDAPSDPIPRGRVTVDAACLPRSKAACVIVSARRRTRSASAPRSASWCESGEPRRSLRDVSCEAVDIEVHVVQTGVPTGGRDVSGHAVAGVAVRGEEEPRGIVRVHALERLVHDVHRGVLVQRAPHVPEQETARHEHAPRLAEPCGLSGGNINPCRQTTTSNDSSANGRLCMSAARQSPARRDGLARVRRHRLVQIRRDEARRRGQRLPQPLVPHRPARELEDPEPRPGPGRAPRARRRRARKERDLPAVVELRDVAR